MSVQIDLELCRALPKVELHAHLTGSITRPILQEIWEHRAALEPDLVLRLPEPRIALADAKVGQDISVFFSHFNTYIYHLITTSSALIYATKAVLKAFQNDGVRYLELRSTPRALTDVSVEGATRGVLEVMKAWNQSEKMRVGLLLSVDRSKFTSGQAEEVVNLALRLKGEGLPVLGMDLGGDPSKLIDIKKFRAAFTRAKCQGLGLAIHFAEVPASSSKEELEEILSWQPDRLGHVVHVPLDMRQAIIKKGIHVELCLTCNILAGMLPDHHKDISAKDHHFDWWYRHAPHLISLGTDDVGVFGSESSEEYMLVSEHFGLNHRELLEISRNAMAGCLCEEEECSAVLRDLDLYAKIHFP